MVLDLAGLSTDLVLAASRGLNMVLALAAMPPARMLRMRRINRLRRR